MITPKQIKAARALAGWTQAVLATQAGLAEVSIRKIEAGDTDPRASTLQKIETSFERVGIVFTERGGVAQAR